MPRNLRHSSTKFSGPMRLKYNFSPKMDHSMFGEKKGKPSKGGSIMIWGVLAGQGLETFK